MKSKRIACGLGVMLAVAFGHAAEPADIDLGWIGGHWCGGDGNARIDEVWLPAHGGRLHGVSRMTKGEAVASFEFLRIEAVDGVPIYFAQPGGRTATAFKRTEGGADWVRFENPDHDFPQRIEYRRNGDRLHAEISGPGRNGRSVTIPFELRRCGE